MPDTSKLTAQELHDSEQLILNENKLLEVNFVKIIFSKNLLVGFEICVCQGAHQSHQQADKCRKRKNIRAQAESSVKDNASAHKRAARAAVQQSVGPALNWTNKLAG